MRNTLLALLLFFSALIVTVGFLMQEPPAGFPSNAEFLSIVRQTTPLDFPESLAARLDTEDLDSRELRMTLILLDEISRTGYGSDKITAEGFKGAILLKYWNPEAALVLLERAMRETRSANERDDLLWLTAQAQFRIQDAVGLRKTCEELKKLGHNNSELKSFLNLEKAVITESSIYHYCVVTILWLLLLILPTGIMKLEIQVWLRKFPSGSDRVNAYDLFRSSPLSAFLCVATAVAFILLGIPRIFHIQNYTIAALCHLSAAYLATLIPLFSLDKEVRGTTWTLWDFIITDIKLNIFKSLHLFAVVIAILILHLMAKGLPMWPVLWPWGVGLGFPALFGALLLFIETFFPTILGLKLLWKDELKLIENAKIKFYRWDLSGSGIFNAFSFGYLTPAWGVALSGPLLEKFSAGDINAIAAHEDGHLSQGHLFFNFLLLFNLALIAGLFAATWPLSALRLLLAGPTYLQVLCGFFLYWMLSRVFSALSRKHEYDSDLFAASKVGRENYLRTLTRLTEMNYLPFRKREDEPSISLHPSLQERKAILRRFSGKYYEPKGNVPSPVLIALWKSRLTIDWKCGECEAIDLCSLDENFSGTDARKQIMELAERHSKFGAECLISDSGLRLEIINCAQKACARDVDPPLPEDRICVLCSGGMLKAITASEDSAWVSTPNGCILSSPGDEKTGDDDSLKK